MCVKPLPSRTNGKTQWLLNHSAAALDALPCMQKPQVPRRSTLHSSQAHAKPRPRGVSPQDSSQLFRAKRTGRPPWTQLKLQQQDHRLSQSAETAVVAKLWDWFSMHGHMALHTKPDIIKGPQATRLA